MANKYEGIYDHIKVYYKSGDCSSLYYLGSPVEDFEDDPRFLRIYVDNSRMVSIPWENVVSFELYNV